MWTWVLFIFRWSFKALCSSLLPTDLIFCVLPILATTALKPCAVANQKWNSKHILPGNIFVKTPVASLMLIVFLDFLKGTFTTLEMSVFPLECLFSFIKHFAEIRNWALLTIKCFLQSVVRVTERWNDLRVTTPGPFLEFSHWYHHALSVLFSQVLFLKHEFTNCRIMQ